MCTKLSLKQPSSNSPGIITWNLFKKRGQKKKMAKRREAVGGRRHYSPGGSWKIDGVSKVVAVVSVSYRDGRQVRGGLTRVLLLSAAYRPSSRRRGTRFINFFLSLSPSSQVLGSPSGTSSGWQRGGGGSRDIDWKLGKVGILVAPFGQARAIVPPSCSCQSRAWLNLWMIKRWMVSGPLVK